MKIFAHLGELSAYSSLDLVRRLLDVFHRHAGAERHLHGQDRHVGT